MVKMSDEDFLYTYFLYLNITEHIVATNIENIKMKLRRMRNQSSQVIMYRSDMCLTVTFVVIIATPPALIATQLYTPDMLWVRLTEKRLDIRSRDDVATCDIEMSLATSLLSSLISVSFIIHFTAGIGDPWTLQVRSRLWPNIASTWTRVMDTCGGHANW